VFLKLNSLNDHASDLRLSKIKRPTARVVEKPIHREKSFSGGDSWREATPWRQATMQAPGQEDRVADGVIVGQAAGVDGQHKKNVASRFKNSQGRLAIGRRLATCPTLATLKLVTAIHNRNRSRNH
jgi:hypothetical protein